MAAAMQPRRNAGLSLNAAGQPQLATAIYNRGGGGAAPPTPCEDPLVGERDSGQFWAVNVGSNYFLNIESQRTAPGGTHSSRPPARGRGVQPRPFIHSHPYPGSPTLKKNLGQPANLQPDSTDTMRDNWVAVMVSLQPKERGNPWQRGMQVKARLPSFTSAKKPSHVTTSRQRSAAYCATPTAWTRPVNIGSCGGSRGWGRSVALLAEGRVTNDPHPSRQGGKRLSDHEYIHQNGSIV